MLVNKDCGCGLTYELVWRNSKFFERLPRGKNGDSLKSFHREQIVVASDDCVGSGVHRAGEYMNIIRVAQRGGNGDGAAFDDQRGCPDQRDDFLRVPVPFFNPLAEFISLDDFLELGQDRGRNTQRGNAVQQSIH